MTPSPVEPVSPTAPPLTGPTLMSQQWRDLTFLHWAVDPGQVAGLMPPGLRPDEHAGATYVGLVPFRMVGAGFGPRPAVPYLGTFLETNVRLYSVDDTGRRGIVVLSLDTDRAAVVGGARGALSLPYRWARMRYQRWSSDHVYDARLRQPGRPRSHVVVRAGEPRASTELDHFLSARWGLHVAPWWSRGRTIFVPNEHPTWPLRTAEVLELDDQLVASVGLPGLTTRPPDHVAFSDGVRTTFGLPHRAA